MTSTMTPYRSTPLPHRDGFAQQLHAEWTKLRTVRPWMTGLAAVPVMLVLFALIVGTSSDQHGRPAVPLGPGGEPVTDSFYFVHRQLAGDGTITVSVAGLTENTEPKLAPGLVPWAKAGLIIEQNTSPGSSYAAIMVTGSHGVRMQTDYVHDTPGLAAPGPATASAGSVRWLRLHRSGDLVTGYDSADGENWTEAGTAHLAGSGTTVQAGLFVASPLSVQGFGTVSSIATADFGNVDTRGDWVGENWSGEQVGAASRSFAGYPLGTAGSFSQSGGTFTVTGAGDIAPAARESLGAAGVLADLLFGTFPALITVIVIGTRFVTDEYRDELIHVTLTASPRRNRVLAAKAVVLGVVTFSTALPGTLVAVPVGVHLARAKGVYLFPSTTATQLRVEIGTAALLATAAVLALALGTVFRRSSGAITVAAVAIVVPYLLVAQIPFLPVGAADWLTEVTPAAAFATQQTLVSYPQVTSIYTPYNGYYPLTPWLGYAVLAGYAAVSLALAAALLRRRDA